MNKVQMQIKKAKEEAKKIIKQHMMEKLPVDAVLDIEIKDFIADVEGD